MTDRRRAGATLGGEAEPIQFAEFTLLCRQVGIESVWSLHAEVEDGIEVAASLAPADSRMQSIVPLSRAVIATLEHVLPEN